LGFEKLVGIPHFVLHCRKRGGDGKRKKKKKNTRVPLSRKVKEKKRNPIQKKVIVV